MPESLATLLHNVPLLTWGAIASASVLCVGFGLTAFFGWPWWAAPSRQRSWGLIFALRARRELRPLARELERLVQRHGGDVRALLLKRSPASSGTEGEASFASGEHSHSTLYRHPEAVKALLEEVGAKHKAAWPVVEAFLNDALAYKHLPILGDASAWPEILERQQSRLDRAVHRLRIAASWMVLLGLAGTVLGFVQALPDLQGAFSAVEERLATTDGTNSGASELAEESPAEGTEAPGLLAVLGDLRGVFLATLSGVVLALLLSGLATLGLEPAYHGLLEEMEPIGHRWLLPIVQSPEKFLDHVVQVELSKYFEGLTLNLKTTLQPTFDQLKTTLAGETQALEAMAALARTVADEIRSGRKSLGEFQGTVTELGKSSQAAILAFDQVARSSVHLLAETRRSQEEGEKRLGALIERLQAPTETFAAASREVHEAALRFVELQAASGEHARGLQRDLLLHREGILALIRRLETAAEQLPLQTKATTELTASVGAVDGRLSSLAAELATLCEGFAVVRDLVPSLAEVERLLAELNGQADALPQQLLAALQPEVSKAIDELREILKTHASESETTATPATPQPSEPSSGLSAVQLEQALAPLLQRLTQDRPMSPASAEPALTPSLRDLTARISALVTHLAWLSEAARRGALPVSFDGLDQLHQNMQRLSVALEKSALLEAARAEGTDTAALGRELRQLREMQSKLLEELSQRRPPAEVRREAAASAPLPVADLPATAEPVVPPHLPSWWQRLLGIGSRPE